MADPTRIVGVARLYVDILDRDPDPGGLRHHVDSGLPLEQIASNMRAGNERKRVVQECYQEVLGRAADAGGLDAFRLSTFNRSGIKFNLTTASDEFEKRMVEIYEGDDPDPPDPGGRPKKGTVLLLGDSDSTEESAKFPSSLHTALNNNPTGFWHGLGWHDQVVERANGNTPAAAHPGTNSSEEQVRNALAEFPNTTVCLLRFGRNDSHHYLSPPTDPNLDKFRAGYKKLIDIVQDAGALPVIYTLSFEDGSLPGGRNDGIWKLNEIIRDLARTGKFPLIDMDFGPRTHPGRYYSTDPVAAHLDDDGHAALANLTGKQIQRFFNGIPKTKPITQGFQHTISNYGGHLYTWERINRHLDLIAGWGYEGTRDWPQWEATDGRQAIKSDGRKGAAWREFVYYVRSSHHRGLHTDISLHAPRFDNFAAHERGLRLCYDAIREAGVPARSVFIDLSNENDRDDRLDAGEIRRLYDLGKSLNSNVLITVSVSGPEDFVEERYKDLLRDGAKLDIFTPHFPRNSSAGQQTANRVRNFKRAMSNAGHNKECYLQEPFRIREEMGQVFEAQDYYDLVTGARNEGATGVCQHNDNGFDETKDFETVARPVEKTVRPEFPKR